MNNDDDTMLSPYESYDSYDGTTLRPASPASVPLPGTNAVPRQVSREDALRRLGALKSRITVAAVCAFVALSGLVAMPRATVPTGTAPSVGQAPSSAGTVQGQGDQSTQQPQGGYFDQGQQSQGDFFDQGQGGYGFGNGSSTGAPMAGSGAS